MFNENFSTVAICLLQHGCKKKTSLFNCNHSFFWKPTFLFYFAVVLFASATLAHKFQCIRQAFHSTIKIRHHLRFLYNFLTLYSQNFDHTALLCTRCTVCPRYEDHGVVEIVWPLPNKLTSLNILWPGNKSIRQSSEYKSLGLTIISYNHGFGHAEKVLITSLLYHFTMQVVVRSRNGCCCKE